MRLKFEVELYLYPTQIEFSVHVDIQVVHHQLESFTLTESEVLRCSIQGYHSWLFAVIIITFSGILSINLITGKIYNKMCISFIEISIYINLILLSVLSLTPAKGTGLVYAIPVTL